MKNSIQQLSPGMCGEEGAHVGRGTSLPV